MGEMADFANEYQDSTMEEYYDYFNGAVDIPHGEQTPELYKESENVNDGQEVKQAFFEDGFLWKYGGKVNIRELRKQDGFTRQYTHKAKGGVYTVVTIAKAAGDIRLGGYGPIIVYKNENGDLFSRSLKSFEDFMDIIV